MYQEMTGEISREITVPKFRCRSKDPVDRDSRQL
jgi:hypothetical protein